MADVVAKFKLENGSELPIGKSFISSLKSVSESTSDAGSINYGTLANSGSIAIQDGNGYISKMIDDGLLPVSDIDVNIEVNGNVFQQHITTDSDYNTEDNTLNIALSNFIKDFDVLKYKGYVYQEESKTLYDLFFDVLNSYFKTTTDVIDSMFNQDVLDYIKAITIQYPFIEKNKTYRQVLDELCTIAQLNMFATKENSLRFMSARPVYSSSDEVKNINLGNIVKNLKYTKTLKNNFDGVEIEESVAVFKENSVIFTSDGLIIYDSNNNYIAGNSGVNPSGYSFFKYDMEYSGYIRISFEYDLDMADARINPNNIDDITFRINISTRNYSFVVKGQSIGLGSNTIDLGGGSEYYVLKPVSAYNGTRPSVVMNRIEGTNKISVTVYIHNGGLDAGGYDEGNYPYSYPQTLTVDIMKKTLDFNSIVSNTDNIENSKTKVSVSSNNLLQNTTKYNGEKISDVIKNNILSDYRMGISDGTLVLNKDIFEIGDLVKYPHDKRTWRVVGKEFNYDGEYTYLISVMQCLIAPSGYGVYDDNGYLLYDWNDLVESGVVTVEGGVITSFDKTIAGNLTIPNTITEIGNSAFSSSKLKSIEVSSSVTDIGDRAFEYCSQATKILIPDSVNSIGYGAFSKCSSLETISLGPNITIIGGSCFSGCYNLKSISIKGRITSIGANAFDECRSLVIEIPTTVTSIGNYAFYGCRSITSVTIPSGVEQLGEWTFASCSKLTTVNLTNNITRMGKGCFADTIALESITIPTSLLFIQEQLFISSGLTSITIPTNIKFIGPNAFAGCEKLATATFKSPSGWVVGTGESLNLSNTSTNALYLRETYAGQEWTQY